MSKLIDIPAEIEAAFYKFIADATVRVLTTRTTPLFALRSAFRTYVRAEDLGGKVTDAQFAWLLDEANLHVEPIPLRTGQVVPHVCGIRLIGETK